MVQNHEPIAWCLGKQMQKEMETMEDQSAVQETSIVRLQNDLKSMQAERTSLAAQLDEAKEAARLSQAKLKIVMKNEKVQMGW